MSQFNSKILNSFKHKKSSASGKREISSKKLGRENFPEIKFKNPRKPKDSSLVQIAIKTQPTPESSVHKPDHQSPTASMERCNKIENQAPRLNWFIKPNDGLRHAIEGFILNQRSPHTQRAYTKDIQRFVKYLVYLREHEGDTALDARAVIGYRTLLREEGLSDTTVDRHLASLKSLFKWLEEESLIEANPVRRVRFLKPKRHSPTRGFTDEEVQRVLRFPNLHSRAGSQHYAILLILFYCGLRRSEICELKISSLDEEKGIPFLRVRGKGNSERLIPLMDQVVSGIRHHIYMSQIKTHSDRYLFSPTKNNRTGNKNKALDPSMIFRIVQRYSKKAGIGKKVSPHSCRATAISNARDRNVSDRAIQEFAGWSTPDMLTRYDKRKTALSNSAAHSIQYGDDKSRVPDWIRKTPFNSNLKSQE